MFRNPVQWHLRQKLQNRPRCPKRQNGVIRLTGINHTSAWIKWKIHALLKLYRSKWNLSEPLCYPAEHNGNYLVVHYELCFLVADNSGTFALYGKWWENLFFEWCAEQMDAYIHPVHPGGKLLAALKDILYNNIECDVRTLRVVINKCRYYWR